MTIDIMPWLVNMRRLDRYNITQSYDRWAEEVQGLCYMAGVSKAITEKGAEGDEMARIIIMFSLERDLRDFMSGKISTASAAELWNGVKKAKKVLDDEAKAAAKSPRADLNNSFGNMSVGGSGGGWN